MGTTETTAQAVGRLTADWTRIVDGSSGTVFTAVGVWPLLAFLAAGADEPVRRELEEVLGAHAEDAAGRARDLLAVLRELPGTSAAIGLWTREHLVVEPQWLACLGPGSHARLTGDPAEDQATMDAWASDRTDGIIERMPVRATDILLLVLASAVTVRTRWLRPFGPTLLRPGAGPWAGRLLTALTVDAADLFDRLAVAETAAGPVTEVRLPGTGDVDVHLLAGEADAPLGAVLSAGLDLVAQRCRRIPVTALPTGSEWPGLTVRAADSLQPHDRLALTTVPFALTGEHDLLDRPPVFGLATATEKGGFSGISRSEPLAVSSARQNAAATFGAHGFEASAVTAVGMSRSAAGFSRPLHRITLAEAVFDRPFAFLAVHRPSALPLAAGWITEPDTSDVF
ncbi:serpin family protein [Kitasatospora sp. KL5]|uniref:serpin family protein n=1 Tax=Kitasatospora sp. KL5 TaxID=3425125 RepID=UPI003D6DC6A9